MKMKLPKILNKNRQNKFKKIENSGEVIEDNPMQDMVSESNEDMKELEEEVIEDKKVNKKPKEVIQVVKELHMQPVRRAIAEDGTIINYITTEEYLTKLANEED